MASEHTLLLLRHAQAADFSPAGGDHARTLTDRGLEQAEAVGNAIRSHRLRLDHVICSAAMRTRQTWNALALDTTYEFTDDVYNAGSDSLLELVHILDEEIGTAMIIGHGPGLPTLAAQLAGPDSDQRARDTVNSRYPTATLSCFRFTGTWTDLQVADLIWVRLGS